jgi:hypothetical protein
LKIALEKAGPTRKAPPPGEPGSTQTASAASELFF